MSHVTLNVPSSRQVILYSFRYPSASTWILINWLYTFVVILFVSIMIRSSDWWDINVLIVCGGKVKRNIFEIIFFLFFFCFFFFGGGGSEKEKYYTSQIFFPKVGSQTMCYNPMRLWHIFQNDKSHEIVTHHLGNNFWKKYLGYLAFLSEK
jgi:hypothetical protein